MNKNNLYRQWPQVSFLSNKQSTKQNFFAYVW